MGSLMPPLPIIGHDKVYRELCVLHAQSRLGPSLLFSGGEGIGKKTLALYWVKSLLCTAPVYESCWESGESGLVHPCGVCASCVQVDAKASADLMLIAGSGEGSGSQISIQKIRELKTWALLASLSGRKKVALIDNAHALHRSAANALLKLLEEPPPDLIICLVTAQPSQLPATIRSRTLTLRFHAPAWGPGCEETIRAHYPEIPAPVLKQWFDLLCGGIGTLLRLPLLEWEDLRRDLYAHLLQPPQGEDLRESLISRLKSVKAERWLVFDMIAALLRDTWMISPQVASQRGELFAESRRAYREVLHDELFWEDFLNRWSLID